MRRPDLTTGATHIRVALEDLDVAWQDVRAEWDDAVSDRFAEQYIHTLAPRVKTALDAIERMAQLLDGVVKTCSE